MHRILNLGGYSNRRVQDGSNKEEHYRDNLTGVWATCPGVPLECLSYKLNLKKDSMVT